MRSTLVVAAIVSVTALTYAGYHFSNRSSTAVSGPVSAAPQAILAPLPQNRLAAPSRPKLNRAETSNSGASRTKPLALQRKGRSRRDLNRDDHSARASTAGNDLAADRVNLMPAPPASTGRLPTNPKDQRWIGALSGGGARVRMRQTRQDLSCATTNCERPPNPQDIQIVGVRVKTQQLAEMPQAPLDGKLKQGHYAEGTPGLYVE